MSSRKLLSIVWLIFACIFLALALYHLHLVGQSAPDFTPPERPLAGQGSVKILGMDVDQPMKDFSAAYNSFVHAQNASSRGQNLASFWGYIAAFLTAIFSFALELAPRREKKSDNGSVQPYV